MLFYIINTYSNIFTSTAPGTFGSSFVKVGCQGTQLSTVKRLFFWLCSNTAKITSLIWETNVCLTSNSFSSNENTYL